MPNNQDAAPVQLQAGQMKLAEQVRHLFAIDVDSNVTPEQMLRPEFWAHHAQHMAPWARIEARARDGQWFAEILVLDVSRTWAKVKILHMHRLTTKDVSMTQASEQEIEDAKRGYTLVHRGAHKWSVVRAIDKAVMSEGDQIKEDAQAKLEEFARVDIKGGAAVLTA